MSHSYWQRGLSLVLSGCRLPRSGLSGVRPLSPMERQLSGCYAVSGLQGIPQGSVLVLDTVPLAASRVRVNRLTVEGQPETSGMSRSIWFIDPLRGDSVVLETSPGRELVLAALGDSMVGNEYGHDDMGRRWQVASGTILRRRPCGTSRGQEGP